jgi:hypothetical protein
MTNYTPEQLEAARKAKTPEELINMAKDAGVDLSAEEAEDFLDQWKQSEGKLMDRELENVAGGHGGMCHKGNREVVTLLTMCVHNLKDYVTRAKVTADDRNVYGVNQDTFGVIRCGSAGKTTTAKETGGECKWLSYEKGLWLCNYPEHLKK